VKPSRPTRSPASSTSSTSSTSSASPSALADLRDKYVEMLAMRIEHAAGDEDEARVPKRMARLAAKYPGALREIDELEIDVIRARIAGLEATLAGQGKTEEWMHALAAFHALARGALYAKRWLAGRKRVDAGLARAYEGQAATFEFSADALQWSGDLARIARPPRGRLLDLVFARVALRLGTTHERARTLVFRPRKRKNARGPRA
jgi:hypothetical protein